MALAFACSRTTLDAPSPASHPEDCGVPRASRSCSRLSVIGPRFVDSAGGGALVQGLENHGQLDLLYAGGGSGQPRGVQRLTVDKSTFELGPVMPISVGSLALAGDRIGALSTSWEGGTQHAHFQVYDANYQLLSDTKFDDGPHYCSWGPIACNVTTCVATCSEGDGPRFVTFALDGTVLSGPDGDGLGVSDGWGDVVFTACGHATTAWDSRAYVRFHGPGAVSDSSLLLDHSPVYPYEVVAWPYDNESIVWSRFESATAAIERMDRQGHVSVLSNQIDPMGAFGFFLRPTSFGLVAVRITQEGNVPTVTAPMSVHVFGPDDGETAKAELAGGYLSAAAVGETDAGLVIVWQEYEQKQDPPVATSNVSIQAALITCAE